jgi:hypothetical protein
MSTRSTWLDWKPEAPITGKTPRHEPTKPTKPGFVGFVGPTLETLPIIEAAPDLSPDEGKSATWAEWKASMLNKLFLEQGVTGQPGKITAATVRHGERVRE